LSIAEAQACAVPVLTSSISPLDEVVDNGRSGWLIEPNDHEEFARRAIDLLGSDELRHRFGAAGRAFIVDRYRSDVFARRVMDLYGRL
jgi:glycosyltransferase involved in cell wall biosynthesis